MANIPIPENDDSLELNVRYQPDMVLEGMLDATVPEMKYLRLSQGGETHDLLGGGGIEPFVIEVEGTSENPTFSCTAVELLAALRAGKLPIIMISQGMFPAGYSDTKLKLIPDVEGSGTGFSLRKVFRNINALDNPLGFYDLEIAVNDAYEDDGVTYPAEIFVQAMNMFTITITIT